VELQTCNSLFDPALRATSRGGRKWRRFKSLRDAFPTDRYTLLDAAVRFAADNPLSLLVTRRCEKEQLMVVSFRRLISNTERGIPPESELFQFCLDRS
jgi:hypothetical protein